MGVAHNCQNLHTHTNAEWVNVQRTLLGKRKNIENSLFYMNIIILQTLKNGGSFKKFTLVHL